LLAVVNVSDPEADEIAAAQIAVDSEVAERKLAHPAFHLQAALQRRDVPELEPCRLADDLALCSMARGAQRLRWTP
jgi:hypothetical protein